MTTEEIEYIEPTHDHIGQMVEVKYNDVNGWVQAKLTGILQDDYRFAAKRDADAFSYSWKYARIPRPLTYAQRQARSGFKVGDKVRFARKFEHGEQGYKLVWFNDLENYLGHTGTIEKMEGEEGGSGGNIFVGGMPYVLPYFVLEKVEPQYREIQCDIGAKVVRINLNNKPTEYTLHNIFVDSDGCKFGVVKDLTDHWDVIELCDLRIEVQ